MEPGNKVDVEDIGKLIQRVMIGGLLIFHGISKIVHGSISSKSPSSRPIFPLSSPMEYMSARSWPPSSSSPGYGPVSAPWSWPSTSWSRSFWSGCLPCSPSTEAAAGDGARRLLPAGRARHLPDRPWQAQVRTQKRGLRSRLGAPADAVDRRASRVLSFSESRSYEADRVRLA